LCIKSDRELIVAATSHIFVDPEILYSADINQVVVHRFTSTALRDALLTSPVAGNVAYVIGTGLQIYSGSVWVTIISPTGALVTPGLTVGTTTFDGAIMSGPVNMDWRSSGDVYVSASSTGKVTLRNLTTGKTAIFTSTGQLQITDGSSTGGLLLGTDVNLYRSSTNTLATDDALIVNDYIQCLNLGAGTAPVATVPITASSALNGVSVYAVNTVAGGNTSYGCLHSQSAVAGGKALSAQVVSDTQRRYQVGVDGLTEWGTGSGAVDTNLYRSAADTLKTDDTFNAVAGVQINGTSVLARSTHTGTQSADTLTDGTTNKAFLATERTKLTGIATSATANSADATLLARANHTGTQTTSTISDYATATDARITNKVAALAGGVTDYIFTSETTTSTTYTNLATVGPTITMPNLIAGQLVLVIISAIVSVTTGGISHSANMGYAVSGVETLAAGLPNIISTHDSNSNTMEQTTLYIVGVSGSHTFQTKYNTTSGDTATFLNRRITAVAVG
jgi:hypothetical protein